MLNAAEDYCELPVKNAIVTVPDCYNTAQKLATLDTCIIAGLEKVKFLSEALCCILDRSYEVYHGQKKNFMIVDIGSSKITANIYEVSTRHIKLLGSRSDCTIGGVDIDHKLVDFILDVIKQEHNIDYSTNRKMMARILIQAGKVKTMLAGNGVNTETFQIDGMFDDDDFEYDITRAQVDHLCEDLYKSYMSVVTGALEDSKLEKAQLDDITLIGGGTRVPAIQSKIVNFMNDATVIKMGSNPEEAIAQGAAIFGYKMDIGEYLTEGVNLNCEDSYGIQAYDVKEGKLVFDPVITKITEYDYSVNRVYKTRFDNQTQIRMDIVRRYKAKEEDFVQYKYERLADLLVTNLQPAPKGEEGARVIFYIDEKGKILVSASDAKVGAKNHYQNLT